MTKVVLSDAKDARSFEIESLLLQQRKVFLDTAIDNEVASRLVKELLWLESTEPGKPITLYLNSPGGSVVDGMAIYDVIQRITSPVHCIVTGFAASMGAVILSGCARGERAILPHGEVLLHQPLGGAEGQATDIEISARRLLRMKKMLIGLLSENTGQPYDKVNEDCDRDYWMSAQEALEYGIIDRVLT